LPQEQGPRSRGPRERGRSGRPAELRRDPLL
jgi:hypothetical protein